MKTAWKKFRRTLGLLQGKDPIRTLAALLVWGLLGSYAFAMGRYLVVEIFHEKVNLGLIVGGGIAPFAYGFLRLIADAQERFESLQERADGLEARVQRNEELLLRLDAKVEVLSKMEATNARVDRLVEAMAQKDAI